MKPLVRRQFLAVCMTSLVGIGGTGGALAQTSVQASAQASANAAQAIAASGRATLALSAVPLSMAGAVLNTAGGVSAAAARDSLQAAGGPLPITEETITVVPPDVALRPREPQPKN